MHAWILLLLVAGSYATPQFSNLVVHENRASAPDGFTRVSPAPADQSLNLRIALSKKNITGLEEILYAVSTPGSPLYGQHLSKEEVEEYVRPTNETTSIVNEFLQTNNISSKSISPAGDWLAFSIPVGQANNLFGANYSIFEHEATGSKITRTLSYSIPVELQGHLELIHPSISFDVPVSQFSTNVTCIMSLSQNSTPSRLGTRQSIPSSCQDTITPSCLQALYGIPTGLATQTTNQIGIISLGDEFASNADLQTYLENLRPDIIGFTFNVLSLDDAQTIVSSPEANVLTQVAAGLASKVPMSFIIVGSDTNDGPLDGLLDVANALLSQNTPPQVLSHANSQSEDTVSAVLANQLCNAFMQLGARGVSVLAMSGFECQDDPTFPSGCPFVTSVGATSGIPESGSLLSSGGFSKIFTQPSYQSTAVTNYLSSTGSEDLGSFDKTGRAFPDVSALGWETAFVFNGDFFVSSGSDISTTVFASVIALLNDGLISQGKPPMGFLNPFLYSVAPEVPILNDISAGFDPSCSSEGFVTVSGWDPVTGLGTPNFPIFKAFLESNA